MIDVCICTHNPRQEVLSLIIKALAHQEINNEFFRVIIVDNGSTPPLRESILNPLQEREIECNIIQEMNLGIVHARIRAIKETTSEWILFVDDDNELAPDYIKKALVVMEEWPDVGCFGGKLILPPYISPQKWVLPFLPFLGIKDAGDNIIHKHSTSWGLWEPPTAGAFINRKVLNNFMLKEGKAGVSRLGRSGKKLLSCEDSMIMRAAAEVGLANGYFPQLELYHHLDPKRFNFPYLVKLLYGYGISQVILENLLCTNYPIPIYYHNLSDFLILLMITFLKEKRSLSYAIAMIAYHVGARKEHLSLAVGKS